MRHASKAGAVLGFTCALLLCVPTVATSADSLTPSDLAGVWRWSSSTGGVAGVTSEADAHLQLEFSADGKVRLSRDGVVTEGSFQLRDDPVAGQVLHLDLEGECDPYALPPCLDQDLRVTLFFGELRLAEPCCDGWRHDFPRDAAELLPVLHTSMGEMKIRWESAAHR